MLKVRLLDQTHVHGLGTLVPWGGLKLDFVVLLERLETRACDGRVVNEHVFATIAWADESEPLRAIEPLHDPLHDYNIFKTAQPGHPELKQTYASIITRPAQQCTSDRVG